MKIMLILLSIEFPQYVAPNCATYSVYEGCYYFLNISLVSHNVLKMMMNIAKDCMILAHIRPSGAEDAFTHALEAGRFC